MPTAAREADGAGPHVEEWLIDPDNEILVRGWNSDMAVPIESQLHGAWLSSSRRFNQTVHTRGCGLPNSELDSAEAVEQATRCLSTILGEFNSTGLGHR